VVEAFLNFLRERYVQTLVRVKNAEGRSSLVLSSPSSNTLLMVLLKQLLSVGYSKLVFALLGALVHSVLVALLGLRVCRSAGRGGWQARDCREHWG